MTEEARQMLHETRDMLMQQIVEEAAETAEKFQELLSKYINLRGCSDDIKLYSPPEVQ